MFKPTVMLGLLCAFGAAHAADAVTDAIQASYVPYRIALFKTNSNAQAEALQAVKQAQQGWAQLATAFASPPAPYDRDAGFAQSLAEVDKVYKKAEHEIEANQLGEAHETLEHARDIIAALRHRNNVVVYSDHMNAYHAQMEWVLTEGPKALDRPEGADELIAQTGVLTFLAERLKTEAPPEYAKQTEFGVMLAALQKSVADLKAAVLTRDAARIREAIAKVKAPYAKMFVKFG
ncbi:hypothetical protein [Uliginosibacterium gangwonense]|uniref:hypothetical protein n=1 Tax=Uliginosibacterium gangwonense TaxID=392736 RepID=UPI0003751CC3|nr:hypothetical protein [Uliginosibacterium gangwonense]